MYEDVDVLLIHPGNRKEIYQGLGNELCAIEPPAYAGLIATYLRLKFKKVAIIDAPALQLTPNEVAEYALNNYTAKLVVLVVYGQQPSASTQNMTAAGQICGAIKDRNTATKILMTGTHPAALPERTLREESIDFVCDGEGPVTIYKTLLSIDSGARDYTSIPSLWWRRKGEVVSPVSIEPLMDKLDEQMPGIAWDLLPMEKYRAHNWHSFEHLDARAPYASIHTTLGCPYKCSFCCINAPFGKASYRLWKPETIIKEIDKLVYEYGITNIKFVDEMFVLNRRHVTEICDLLISRDYKVNIWAYARVDTVQDELLNKLKMAGFNWLCLGIESASKHVREGAEKRYGNKEIKAVVRKIQKAGIYIIGNYIFGLPDDSLHSMQETLDLALELNCEFANFYCAAAYPGSDLYAIAAKNNYELPSEWHYYSQHSVNTLPLRNENLSANEILVFRDRAFKIYFTNRDYQAMIKSKFGKAVCDHLEKMVEIPLKRKHVTSSTGTTKIACSLAAG